MIVLKLDNLETRHPGVTGAIAASYYEAASVCFDRHHHPPVQCEVEDGAKKAQALTTWKVPNSGVKKAWANDTDTTEAGAYCVSLAAVEALRGLAAISRADTLTGADYYVADADSDSDDLEGAIRLEVSGVDSGEKSKVLSRVASKKKQAMAGTSNLPAMVCVVGFKALLVYVSDVP